MSKFRVNLEVDWGKQIVCMQVPATGVIRWELSFPNGFSVKGDCDMSVTLTDTQKVAASIQPVDAKGNPAVVDGVPSWSVSDSSLLSVETAVDGLSAIVFAVGPLGSGQVLVEADADLGEGIVTLQGILDVTVIGSQATALAIVAGVPEEQ